MTAENLYIAEHGSASHQDRLDKDKSRNFLDSLELHGSTAQKKTNELITFFNNDERIERMSSPIPDYVSLTNTGKTVIHNKWENFETYYKRQLSSMPPDIRDLYYIGLQLVPEFRGHLPPEFRAQAKRGHFPYNILPIIDQIVRLNEKEPK